MTLRSALMVLVAIGISIGASADIQFDQGRWRLELSGSAGIHSGSTDRQGNVLATGSLEYEFPASKRTTLGLRLLPLFLYAQDDDDNVFGAGFGLTGRIYQHAEEYRGWFGELELSALGHDEKIEGNSANLNFLTGVGIGYKFKSNWHAALRYEHISNAGLGEHNAGANAVGLAVGFTF